MNNSRSTANDPRVENTYSFVRMWKSDNGIVEQERENTSHFLRMIDIQCFEIHEIKSSEVRLKDTSHQDLDLPTNRRQPPREESALQTWTSAV